MLFVRNFELETYSEFVMSRSIDFNKKCRYEVHFERTPELFALSYRPRGIERKAD